MHSRVLGVVVVAAAGLGPALVGTLSSAAQAATSGPALSVDTAAGRHKISPDIYGMNFAEPALARELHITVDRWGGNSTSRYNYTNNTFNLANDYFFENVHPDVSLNKQVSTDLKDHTQPLVTVPMTGWVSKNSPSQHPFACGFKVSKYGNQQYTDGYDEDCGNGNKPNGNPITGNDPADTSIKAGPSFDKAMVKHFVSKFGRAGQGGVKTYELDNEPSLWNSTHRDVHPDPLTYDELWNRSRSTATAIKAADPGAKVDGPGDWGWCAYFYSAADNCAPGSDRQSHGDLSFAPWYLKKFAAQAHKTGKRLLDYFDEHWYPQEDGVPLQPAGDAATQALRLRSTRTLWDPSYTDESWTNDLGIGPVALIPRMRGWVQKYYPGTKTAISEYNWGGLESINGALAEADVLGIFGREQLDRALIWTPPKSDEPGAFAFRMYRNYDGSGGQFGNTAVQATSSDQDKISVYAAQRSSDGATTVMVINKTTQALSSGLSVGGGTGASAQVFTYSAQNLDQIVEGSAATLSAGSISHTYPASSITLFVIPSA